MTGGIFDFYTKEGSEHTNGAWNFFQEGVRDADVGIWRILSNAAVFAAVTALLAAIVLLAVSAGGGSRSKNFQEAKKWMIRILVISALIFGVAGLISLVWKMGLG